MPYHELSAANAQRQVCYLFAFVGFITKGVRKINNNHRLKIFSTRQAEPERAAFAGDTARADLAAVPFNDPGTNK